MFDEWYLEHLVCPVTHQRLARSGTELLSTDGIRYPVICGVPVMLREDVAETHSVTWASLNFARHPEHDRSDGLFVDTLGVSETEKAKIIELSRQGSSEIDPVASCVIAATSGYAYKHLVGSIDDYPIPDLRFPKTGSRKMLDIGCNWGRWSIAGARKGYQVIGIDPSLGAVLAAKRIAGKLGLDIKFVVGDARYLPFFPGSFDNVFSYSVLQHFSKPNVHTSLREIHRVLRNGGVSLLQMPNKFGLRSVYHQLKRTGKEVSGFDVRYWSPDELLCAFTKEIGLSDLSVDCYFGLGLQANDRNFMKPFLRSAIDTSEILRSLSKKLKFMVNFADSVYVKSTKTT